MSLLDTLGFVFFSICKKEMSLAIRVIPYPKHAPNMSHIQGNTRVTNCHVDEVWNTSRILTKLENLISHMYAFNFICISLLNLNLGVLSIVSTKIRKCIIFIRFPNLENFNLCARGIFKFCCNENMLVPQLC